MVGSPAVSGTTADAVSGTFCTVPEKSFPADSVSDTSDAVAESSSVVVRDVSPASEVSGSVFEVLAPASSVCLS